MDEYVRMDQKKVDQFAERIFTELNAGMSCLNLYLGYRLDLYRAIADAGAVTPSELAGRTKYSERYLREWLECMAAGGYLDYDSGTGLFTLPPEHAVVLLNRDSSAYSIPIVCYIPSFASTLKPLMNAFRTGDGVPYEQYGPDLLEAIGMGNRPIFVNNYVTKWIPAMPDIENRLRRGGRVLEVGCGLGWSSIVLARGFPETKIDAIDVDPGTIEKARENAKQAGAEKHISFHLGPIEESTLKGPYDLVTTFECIHDLAYPVKALRRMREMATPNGAVLVADEAVGDTLDENRNFLGQLMYNFSVLHCLPQAMVAPDSAATGTVLSPSKLRTYAATAGFSRVEILPIENPIWRLYRLRP